MPLSPDLASAGNITAARMATVVITTSKSVNVKAHSRAQVFLSP
jgi:hypothetical protein